MPRSKKQPNAGPIEPEIPDICTALRRLDKRLRGKEGPYLRAAIQELERLRSIGFDFDELEYDLEEIEWLCKKDLSAFPSETRTINLAALICVIEAVRKFFFRRRVSVDRLEILQRALQELAAGASPPEMLLPIKTTGRRRDGPTIMSVKAIIAGVMHRQQTAGGMSRVEAARWIVRHISPDFASRISRKPLTPRMVTEWLDRYGGKFPEDDRVAKIYKIWSQGEAYTDIDFRKTTEWLAATIPS
jgi:hypothetical protein